MIQIGRRTSVKLPKDIIDCRQLSGNRIVFTTPGKKVWKCSSCDHSWRRKLKKEPEPTKCPKCSNKNIKAIDRIIKAYIGPLKVTPKHAHFAIDLYGKLCFSNDVAKTTLRYIKKIYHGSAANQVLQKIDKRDKRKIGLKGYDIEYILHCLELIFEEEEKAYPPAEINPRTGKPYLGKKLPFQLLKDVTNGIHPVEAMLKAGLRV